MSETVFRAAVGKMCRLCSATCGRSRFSMGPARSFRAREPGELRACQLFDEGEIAALVEALDFWKCFFAAFLQGESLLSMFPDSSVSPANAHISAEISGFSSSSVRPCPSVSMRTEALFAALVQHFSQRSRNRYPAFSGSASRPHSARLARKGLRVSSQNQKRGSVIGYATPQPPPHRPSPRSQFTSHAVS